CEMLRFKVYQIRTRILASLSPSARQDNRLSSAQFSKGWLYRFQQRHDLKMRRLRREAAMQMIPPSKQVDNVCKK
ncbi:hypothetical protein AC1031_016259, partial [Aphanomyces cochlioides]